MAARKKQQRTSRRTARAVAEPVAVEAIEEMPSTGIRIDDGLVLATTLLLLGACVLVWAAGY